MSIRKDRVRFNVGGKIFVTASTTLANAGRNSMLGKLLDKNWKLHPDGPECFIDRNPACFLVLLDLLRTGELHIPANMPEKMLYREASFYGLLDPVRAAKWGPFDGNLLRLASSVTGHALGDQKTIRAAPEGGCCVAHGSIVHVCDWMLEEHPPINFDCQRVNDLGYIDSDNIVVTNSQCLDKGDGGMGVFSSSAELKHRFQVSHDNQFKSFTAGALSFSSDYKIFASCRGKSNECGIGVWDQVTGKQLDSFYESPNLSLGDAYKLHATGSPRKENCYISILDFRDKRMVWSWPDIRATMMRASRDVDRILILTRADALSN